MNINTKDIRIDKIPAGAYYIGDPCYAFTKDHQQWLRLLDQADYFEKPMVEFEGFTVGAFHTAHGDGTYKGVDGNGKTFDFDVDAGLIGFVAAQLLEPEFARGLMEGTNKAGKFVFFPEPWSAASWKDGNIRIGSTLIATDFGEEDDEEEFAWVHSSNCEYPED
jgi:hypothetical protein